MTTNSDDERKEHRVEILINNQHVSMPTDDVMGQDIINAAVVQGVRGVQQDFVLGLEISKDNYQTIGPDQPIEIHSGQKFIANVPDDNS